MFLDTLANWWLNWRTEKARKQTAEGLRLQRCEIDENGFVAEWISPDIAIFAAECARMLDKANAKNYVQFDVMPRISARKRPVRVTVQWAEGESPAEQNARLRDALEKYADGDNWLLCADGSWRDDWLGDESGPDVARAALSGQKGE